MRRAGLAALCASGVLVAGCSSASTTSSQPQNQPAIRGTKIATYSCKAAAVGTPLRVSPAVVTRIRVCPNAGYPSPSTTVSLAESDRQFGVLLHELSVPDEKPTGPNEPCLTYADVPQHVVADTASGPLLVHLPIDGCSHYLRATVQTITKLRTRA